MQIVFRSNVIKKPLHWTDAVRWTVSL